VGVARRLECGSYLDSDSDLDFGVDLGVDFGVGLGLGTDDLGRDGLGGR
jgi:hypothetical protein